MKNKVICGNWEICNYKNCTFLVPQDIDHIDLRLLEKRKHTDMDCKQPYGRSGIDGVFFYPENINELKNEKGFKNKKINKIEFFILKLISKYLKKIMWRKCTFGWGLPGDSGHTNKNTAVIMEISCYSDRLLKMIERWENINEE